MIRAEIDRQLERAISLAAAGPCLLCQQEGGAARVGYIGCWAPSPERQRRLARPGKIKRYLYRLCDECASRDTAVAEAEDAILDRAGQLVCPTEPN